MNGFSPHFFKANRLGLLLSQRSNVSDDLPNLFVSQFFHGRHRELAVFHLSVLDYQEQFSIWR